MKSFNGTRRGRDGASAPENSERSGELRRGGSADPEHHKEEGTPAGRKARWGMEVVE